MDIQDLCLVVPQPSQQELTLKHCLNLGILASGSGSNFEGIAQAIAAGELNAKIQVVVYNNPEAKVIERARKAENTSNFAQSSGLSITSSFGSSYC